MDAATAIGNLQPQATPVDAELGQQGALGVVAHANQAAGLAHHAVHASDQGAIGLLAIAEMESEIFHAPGA